MIRQGERRNTLPEMQVLLAGLSDAERDTVRDEIDEFMRPFERAGDVG